MCGVIAHFAKPGYSTEGALPALAAGRDAMARRGPDGEGLWSDEAAILGHRRLAILDLDPRAAQPMTSLDGRYVVVFNGEIYNYRELRDALVRDGVAFSTTSDTEVLLALFAKEGEAMLPRLAGMFTFVIWDRETKRAFAARDPYGIKPLYLGTSHDGLWVGSQVKGLMATGRIDHAICPSGQAGFWLLGSVPEPYTWRRDIRALPAGGCAWIENGTVVEQRRWKDISDAWRDAGPCDLAETDIRQGVSEALHESAARHLVSDVPIGIFLSGGIDSGALAGLMVDAGAKAIQAVTLAFDEFDGTARDEAPAARLAAEHYGLNLHVRRLGREEFQADLPRILAAMDQPSIDGINTWYAAKSAAELGLKVVVSGVGGDELFQGYDSFRTLPRLMNTWHTLARLPGVMPVAERLARAKARRSGNNRWLNAPTWGRSIAGAWWLRRSLFAPQDLLELTGRPVSRQDKPVVDIWLEEIVGDVSDDPRLALGQIESVTYLQNQLLRDSDWASMDHSVELRTPLVDARLLDAVAPWLSAFERFPGKSLLASAPYKALPESLLRRPKTGFETPAARWLFGDGQSGEGGSGSRKWARRVIETYSETRNV